MIQSIQMHLEWSQIQDMETEVLYIYTTSYSYSISHEECHFSPKMTHDYKCDIDFLQELKKQKVN